MIGYFVAATPKSRPLRIGSAENTKQFESATHRYTICGADSCTACVECDGVLIASLGIVRHAENQTNDQFAVLRQIVADYTRTGEVRVAQYNGSFVLFLVDSSRDTAFVYRNLSGGTAAYHTHTADGFFFGNNLADVVRKSGVTRRVNEDVLPQFFAYRLAPAQATLFQNVARVVPGEIVSFVRGAVKSERVLQVADLLESQPMSESDAIDRLESTTQELMRDWYAGTPQSAVLLSGGVDSTYIQVNWNRMLRQHSQSARSVAVVLDSPHTQGDVEYTESAVRECGTEHTSIVQPPLTPEFMRSIFAATGEMPDHVQSFYFHTLARGMREAGLRAGITGEGADGLWGGDDPITLLRAGEMKRKVPIAWARQMLATCSRLVKPNNCVAHVLELASHINDLDWFHHPINQSSVFTSVVDFEAMFGRAALPHIFAERRRFVASFGIPHDGYNLQWTNLIGYYANGVHAAAYWSEMGLQNGVYLYHPFQDSRMIRVATNTLIQDRFTTHTTKPILKHALARHVSPEFISRPKRGFGQPIFEWLAAGGTLRAAAENIADYPFLPQKVKQRLLQKPNWMLWNLLCFDLWYREFFQ
ncbi:MAG: asparagine synthase-related protein [Thermoguttaceae bacterium]